MKAHLYPEQELKRRAMSWALRLKVNPVALHFEDLREKWGCCSPTGEVTLTLDLVNTDKRFQDYVIVHELLHLRVQSHGKRFLALLSAYVPDWRDLEPHPVRGGGEVRRPEAGRHRDASEEGMTCAGIARKSNTIPAEGAERGRDARLKPAPPLAPGDR